MCSSGVFDSIELTTLQALDDSDIQILKTYVRRNSRQVANVIELTDYVGTRALCAETEED